MLNHRQDLVAQRANFRRALSGDQVLFAALNYATLPRRNPKLLVIMFLKFKAISLTLKWIETTLAPLSSCSEINDVRFLSASSFFVTKSRFLCISERT